MNPKHLPAEVPILLALLKIAKAISSEYCLYWNHKRDDEGILQHLKHPLEFLHISYEDFRDLREQFSHHFA